MPTITWCTGFEYGLATPVTSGAGLFNAVTGAPSIQAATYRTGAYALQSNVAAAVAYVTLNLATPTVIVGRFYINIASHTTPNSINLCDVISTTGHSFSIYYTLNMSRIYFPTGIYGSPTIVSVGSTWYRIDFIFDCSGNIFTFDGQVNGVAVTQQTYNHGAPDTWASVSFGISTVATANFIYDDIALSFTPGDYPLGEGGVIGLRPNVDGTHNNASNIMEDSAGNDIHATNFPAFGYLNEDPWITTADADYVRQTGTGATRYCEINFDDTTEAIIQGTRAILQYASATTNANTGATLIMDSNDQVTNLYGTALVPADMSETSAFYKSIMITAPAGGWTMAQVNALRARFGYSDDANPDPYWLAMMLEVAYGTASTWRQQIIGPF
jgi:hypothetical protein